MNRRDRVKNAMHFKPVDKVPVRFYYCPVGYYEHGDKLNDLYATLPGDFEPFRRVPPTGPAEGDYDSEGKYHAFRTDAWGVTWEYRIFGITGIPHSHPITYAEDIENYVLPKAEGCDAQGVVNFAKQISERKAQDYYTMAGCGSLYEQLIALYGDENVLCDIALGEREIGVLADRITERNAQFVARAVQAEVDAITFGDDYGSEQALLMNPETWREFFKPRLKKLFQPAVDKGIDIHFHSCGKIWDILPDLKDIGVTSIWPQIPAYNMEDLAKYCRELGLAVEVHTDRAKTMTYGTPKEVENLVKREFDTFQMEKGGAWFYVEADNGFPYENLEALVNTIALLRK